MHNIQLLEILAIGFAVAFALGYVTHRLRLSPIVGYLIAGFIVGPNSPGFVADAALASQLAEVGVILLMFGVGLHFDMRDLLAVKSVVVPGAVTASLVTTVSGACALWAIGLPPKESVAIGMGMAVASTVVLTRALDDSKTLDTSGGHVAVGWLIIEDIITVLVLVLLPVAVSSFGADKPAGMDTVSAIGMALAKLVILWALVDPVGGRVVPWILSHIARSRSRELFTLSILTLAFAIAMVSAVIFGVSMALGAFLAGMVVGKTKMSHQAAADVLPMKDAFAVLFFISVGMLFDPAFLISHWDVVLACLAIILLVKPVIAGAMVIIMGYSVDAALTVAFGLTQIGEFSFILAQQAQDVGILSGDGRSVLVACSLISITLNPLLFKMIVPAENWLRGKRRLWTLLNRRAEKRGKAENAMTGEAVAKHTGRPVAIVIGYGPVGRQVSKILRENDMRTVIVDLNVDTVYDLAKNGHLAIYGDASHSDILLSAGIEKAKYLLVTLPDIAMAISIIATARNLNPEIDIFVRARFLNAKSILEGMGVTAISFEEEEVAKAMTEELLRKMG